MKMAETVHAELVALASHCGYKNKASGFESLREKIQGFIIKEPETYLHRTMGVAPVPNVYFEGYEQKIKLLDSSFTLERSGQLFPLPLTAIGSSREPDYNIPFLRKNNGLVPNYFR